MIRPILRQNDQSNSLYEPCETVEKFDEALENLVADMWDTMYAAGGVGLAATQIGSRFRVAVIDTLQTESSNRRLVLVNPRISESRGDQTGNEGCLSMPGLAWSITRAEWVNVLYQDLRGRTHGRTARGLFARAVQHECDHLDGVLCYSRAKPMAGEPIPLDVSRSNEAKMKKVLLLN